MNGWQFVVEWMMLFAIVSHVAVVEVIANVVSCKAVYKDHCCGIGLENLLEENTDDCDTIVVNLEMGAESVCLCGVENALSLETDGF